MNKVKVSPHLHSTMRTDKAMLYVVLALLPAAIWGCIIFSWRAIVVLLLSIGSSLLTEYLLNKISHEDTLMDGSALVTGLLVGMNLSSTVPLYVPVIASAFAIGVCKWTFGGLGCNWANPAIAGRAFVFFSFSSQMSSFAMPWVFKKSAELSSGATPLSALKMELGSGLSSAEVLESVGYPVTNFAQKIGSALNINPYVVDEFFGFASGSIGEVSALLLIAGGIFLMCTHVITWYVPVFFIGSFSLLTWVFGGLANGTGLFTGEVLMSVFSGGLLIGAIFMATDWVTSPNTPKGEVIYAFGCGFFTFIIRYFGSLPEGVSLAILLMNMVTPTIDKFVKRRKFGYVNPVKVKKEEEK